MRNGNSHPRTIKTKLGKSKNGFHAHNDIQLKYGKKLDEDEEAVGIKANIKLVGCELGDYYTTDFYCIRKNGEPFVRECISRERLMKPLTAHMLDASRCVGTRAILLVETKLILPDALATAYR